MGVDVAQTLGENVPIGLYGVAQGDYTPYLIVIC